MMEDGLLDSNVPSQDITPTESNDVEDAIIVVTWYSDKDPDNPHNWSFRNKLCTGLLVLMYTISVYIVSSLCTTSILEITSIFGVGETATALGLSLYVLRYGLGPLLFAPLSKIPAISRNPPYIYTYIIFVGLSVATVLIDNFGGLLVLRFLLGLF
jgi:DHA1 family multidrug resistance protein-like MFS transporter